ncbi:divergent polysaccharide deacetylase family protein [Niveispirillum lacus]|uniref:divergent polysaccharide deacetylase family protein n=1 Tax=Niveispirillum lacus TaxID=1981099 RepID=UPI0013FD791E|nr:divergent polysaccharide deacetylase family protein [Niveispirillum lacus]
MKRGRDRLVHARRLAMLWLARIGAGGRIALALTTLVLVAGGMTALLGEERYHPVAAGPALTPMEEEADASGADQPEDAGDEEAAETADLPARPGAAPPVPDAQATFPAQPPVTADTAKPAAPPTQVAALPAAPPRPLPPLVAAPAGTPVWKHFAVAAPAPNGHPRIVIVIDDMGVDRTRSEKVASLPGPLTLAWLPYARDLPQQTGKARANGHELIVHMPMEPTGKEDPGPGALLTRLDEATLRQRLATNLSAFQGFVGINNHMGSRFTADPTGMAVVMAELGARGLLFLDSRTTANTAAGPLSAHYQVPMLSRDVFLDHVMTAQGVAASLAKVEDIARKNGLAIAIGHPHDVTIAALTQWLPTLQEKGFQLVPLTAAVK